MSNANIWIQGRNMLDNERIISYELKERSEAIDQGFIDGKDQILKCQFCGCTNILDHITDMLDPIYGPVLESKFVCADCRIDLGWFEYGYYSSRYLIMWIDTTPFSLSGRGDQDGILCQDNTLWDKLSYRHL
ncbi:hypothetical protein KAR91_38700 [Candidatus Pacearchaeota archaeon]|nr:hypothetical protein [Candidatus Pacearchaeota archaeon]